MTCLLIFFTQKRFRSFYLLACCFYFSLLSLFYSFLSFLFFFTFSFLLIFVFSIFLYFLFFIHFCLLGKGRSPASSGKERHNTANKVVTVKIILPFQNLTGQKVNTKKYFRLPKVYFLFCNRSLRQPV
ncbi:predicted protein [Methanosarcina acetivorans C2A]|uniref:Uncharacterized protein n=1 Tax=Methanosarcina acetivorans (strain ATCC 35395 / DSM 2834 / JCM 12185 / C2A) TaxID=188937 RepID=Q8TLX5_METAC|nr:predicted protein [Methanosarcina acetivorans C2A]